MSPITTVWAPGQSGNPAGRPRGSRNLTTRAVEKLLDGEAEALTRKAIELALGGDGPALRLCLDRLCPPRKDREVIFDLPAINTPADLPQATAALMRAVAEGDLTPTEAADLAKLIAGHVEAIKVADFSERLAAIEAAEGKGSAS